MSIEIKVSMHLNVNDDYFSFSQKRLSEIAQNVEFLVYQPIPIADSVRKELRKKDNKVKIHFGIGYREIRVVRGFKTVEVTREVEEKYGLKRGIYDFKEVPDDFVAYHVYDYNLIKEDDNPERIALVGMEWFSEERMRELRKR